MENFLIAVMSSISTVTMLTIVAFLSRSLIIERLKASINHEYDLKMFEIEAEREKRLKAELVAELLAECVKHEAKLDYHQLNKLSFQVYLWLPKELAEEVSKSLHKHDNAKDIRKLLKDIREYLNDENDELASKHVVVFEPHDIFGRAVYETKVTSKANVRAQPFRE